MFALIPSLCELPHMRRLFPSHRERPISRLQETISRNLKTSSKHWFLIGQEGARVIFFGITNSHDRQTGETPNQGPGNRGTGGEFIFGDPLMRCSNAKTNKQTKVSDFQSYYGTMQTVF